jgi:hypothetical protein
MPDTTPYLYLGLAIVIVALGLYILSLVVRLRNAAQDTDRLKE